MPDTSPRGIRNNNPGNIRVSSDDWLGKAKPQERTRDQQGEGAFEVFNSPVYGIRAMAKLLQNYQKKHGLWTVRDMLNRWAPAEDSNDPKAYAFVVAKEMGIGPYDEFRFEGNLALSMIKAMIRVENGAQPYSDLLIRQALELAGIDSVGTAAPVNSRQLVSDIQTVLNSHGAAPQLVVDGIWGPKTEAALRAGVGL